MIRNLKSLKIGVVLASSLLILACGNEPSKESEKHPQYRGSDEARIAQDSLDAPIWEYDAQGDSMIQHQVPQNITVDMVLKEFNNRHQDILHLELLRIAQDTVYISIPDASYLTHGMGTTGAFAIMTEVTYSLTEVPGIAFVSFDFEEGDHAVPGVYQRSDFDNKL